MSQVIPRFIIVTLILANFALLFSALVEQSPSGLRAKTATASFCVKASFSRCTGWL